MIARSNWDTTPPGAPVPVSPAPSPDIAARDAGNALAERHSPGSLATDTIDPELVAEWSQLAGTEHHLAVAEKAALSIAAALPPEEATELDASIDTLPASVRTAFIRELAMGGVGGIKPASQALVDRFASETPEQAQLVKQWGGSAARNLARVLRRVERVGKRLSEAEQDGARDWFESLGPAAARSVLRTLAR